MKSFLLLTCGLLLVCLAACAPVETPSASGPPASTLSAATATPPVEPSGQAQTPTEAPASTPLPLATSRGPELHATDPATVSLASGGLQFVEFFRFT